VFPELLRRVLLKSELLYHHHHYYYNYTVYYNTETQLVSVLHVHSVYLHIEFIVLNTEAASI